MTKPPRPATPAPPPAMDYTPPVAMESPASGLPAAAPPPVRPSEPTTHLSRAGGGTRALHSQTPEPRVKAHAKLVISRGANMGKEFPVAGEESQIGRWDADNGIFPDIDLDQYDPEAKVSRRHARIITYNGQYMIEDLGSTNGTFINRGRRLIPGRRQPLHSGDELIVGKTFLKFIVEN